VTEEEEVEVEVEEALEDSEVGLRVADQVVDSLAEEGLLHQDHLHREEHGDLEAKEVILNNNGQMEEERLQDHRERRLEVVVS